VLFEKWWDTSVGGKTSYLRLWLGWKKRTGDLGSMKYWAGRLRGRRFHFIHHDLNGFPLRKRRRTLPIELDAG